MVAPTLPPSPTRPNPPGTQAPNFHVYNFDSWSESCVSVFILLMIRKYPILMEGAMAATSKWACLYFFSFYGLAVLVLINVLVAFILESYIEHYEMNQVQEGRHRGWVDVCVCVCVCVCVVLISLPIRLVICQSL